MNEPRNEIAESISRLNREFNPWIDPLEPDERDALESFCEMAEKLESRSIVKSLLERGEVRSKIKIRDGKVVHAEIENLAEEALDAFLLTARLFRDNKERGSIGNVAVIFDKRVSQRHILWMQFNGNRAGLNEFLNRKDGLPETNNEIFETFLYGGYAHRNRVKYKEWQKKGSEFFQHRKSIFLIVLVHFWWTVRTMCPLVKQLLDGTCPRPTCASTRKRRSRFFSDAVISLNLKDGAKISTGQRISISESLLHELRTFLDEDIADHVRSDQIGEVAIRIEEYGAKIGNHWNDHHDGAMLQLSIGWTITEKIPGGTMIVRHSGRPVVFVTQEFLRHLEPAKSANYDWHFVP